MSTKLVELFSNRVVERRNMIMSIKIEELALRVLGGVLSFLILSFSLLFSLVCYFSCLLVALRFFLVDDFLELFLPFLVLQLCFMEF
jgi:hypothetical protein